MSGRELRPGTEAIHRYDGPTTDETLRQSLPSAIVLGSCAVGKTALVKGFVDGDKYNKKHESTLGVDHHRTETMLISDCAGDSDFQTLQKPIFKNADGLMLVYDVARRSTFDSVVKTAARAVRQARAEGKEPRLKVIYVVANRVSLAPRVVSRKAGEEAVAKLIESLSTAESWMETKKPKVVYRECSVLTDTGDGAKEAFTAFCDDVRAASLRPIKIAAAPAAEEGSNTSPAGCRCVIC